MQTIELRKPITVKGVQHKELHLDLESLTGVDIVKVESEMTAQGKISLIGDHSVIFQSKLAARAAKIPHEELEKIDARDFSRVLREVSNFLFASDSSEESDKQQEEHEQTEPQPESFDE